MAITSIRFTPETPGPGQRVTCIHVGTTTGNEVRYYLLSAPPSSALVTMATYADLGKTLADTRIALDGSGHGVFTPDVPGDYAVVARDITTYRFQPHYQGDVPDGTDPMAADNEEASFTVLGVVTPAATDQPSSSGVTLAVWQQVTRTIGFGPDTASLQIKAANAFVSDPDFITDATLLKNGSTAPAKLAIYDPQVLQVLDLIRTTGNSSNLPTSQDLLAYLVDGFNEHIALQSHKVHTAGDATNTLTSTASVTGTAPSIKTRLDDIVAKYNAHRILTAGSVHAAADVTNVMTAMACTDADTAIAYFEHVYEELLSHATDTAPHDVSTPNEVVDGYFGWLAEPPTTLAEVAQAINGTAGSRWENYGLTSLYEQHRQRVLVYAHAGTGLGPDAVNGVLYLGGSLTNLIVTANALAAALRRHISNQDAAGADAATPYHYTDGNKSRLPRTSASDIRTLAILIEELWICLESHMWSAGPPSGYVTVSTAGARGQHGDRGWGRIAFQGTSDGVRPTQLIRLQKAFDRALSPSVDPPLDVGILAAILILRSGFSLPASPPSPPRPRPCRAGAPARPEVPHGFGPVQALFQRRLVLPRGRHCHGRRRCAAVRGQRHLLDEGRVGLDGRRRVGDVVDHQRRRYPRRQPADGHPQQRRQDLHVLGPQDGRGVAAAMPRERRRQPGDRRDGHRAGQGACGQGAELGGSARGGRR